MSRIASFLRQHQIKAIFTLAISVFVVIVWFAVSSFNEYWFIIPFGLIIVYIAATDIRLFWYLTIFMTPISITSHELTGGIGITFPTDIFALMIMGLLLFKMVSERKWILGYFKHPLVWVLLLSGLWLIFAALDSVRMGVSFKWFTQYVWLTTVFFFVPAMLFRDKKSIFRFFQLVSVAFILALSTIFFFYISQGRNPFGLRFNPGPFFLDHTVFGAFTAMWVPMLFLLVFRGKLKGREKMLAKVALAFFLAGLFFSYSRGAWASCLAALLLMGIFSMRRQVRFFLLPVLVIAMSIGGYAYYAGTGSVSQDNSAVSRKDISSHLASMTNFKTDYSNAERINRWYCAIKMWERDQWTGYGPGTYAMEYDKFQKYKYITPISTHRGDNGTAHNEFLLALSEQGIPGMVITIFLMGLPIFFGMRGFNRSQDPTNRMIYLGVTFGLVAYVIHSFVNNFMDQDKIAMSFYGFMAIIVALDMYALPKERKERQELKGWQELKG